MLLVQQMMKARVVTVQPDTPIVDALRTMADAGIRHLPVVEDDGQLVGIVSHRDLARALDLLRAAVGVRDGGRVASVMKTNVRHATPSTPAAQAAEIMIDEKIGALPVLSDDGRLVGIVTETDFVEIAREALLGLDPASRAHA